MDLMDTMIGKWKIDLSSIENLDAYAAAMQFPEEVKQKIKNENVELELTRDGDTFTVVSTIGDQKETLIFKLGEKFKSKAYGIETENVVTVEGGVFVGRYTFAGGASTTRRYIKDGRLVVEFEGNGTTMKNYMDRC